jgi:HEAT repeat protein
MGTVYLAHDTRLNRRVALKVCAEAGANPEVLARFRREARAAASLRHPNLCPVYDCDVVGGIPYLTMAYIEGPTLADRLAKGGAFPPAEAAALVSKLALAMAEAHAQGVIHRDLKPANIALDRRGEPVILDFGLARQAEAASATLTRVGVVLGTPSYMAPEQVEGHAAGPRSDVYSLGVLLYELLTGRPPFVGPVQAVLAQVLYAETPRPSELLPKLDPRLDTICHKAMAKKPGERYAGMSELAVALDAVLHKRVKAARPENALTETLPTPGSDRTAAVDQDEAVPVVEAASRFRLAWIALAVVVALTAGTGLVWTVKALWPRGAGDSGHASSLSVADLVTQLKEGDRTGRRQAALELAERGPDAVVALRPLAAALRDEAEEVRTAAAGALLHIGPAGLRAEAPDVRAAATRALGELEARADEALPHLAAALRDKEKEVRVAAADGVVKVAPRCLAAQDPEVRRRAAEALGNVGGDAQAVLPQLARAAHDPDDAVRAAAVAALAKVRPTAEEAFSAFLEGLRDRDGAVRLASAQALAQATPSQRRKAALPLGQCLDDAPTRAREIIVAVLGDYGPDAAPAGPALQKAVRDPEPTVRRGAARALGRLGSGVTAATATVLCDALKDPDVAVRQEAVAALGAVVRERTPEAVKALAALAATEPDATVRRLALGKLVDLVDTVDTGVAAQITPLLKNDDRETARQSAYVLAILGGDSALPALDVLRGELKESDPRRQELAAAGLARIGGRKASAAVPDLIQALSESKNLPVRRNCILALGKIGSEAKAAVPELIRALDAREDAALRMQAAEALHGIGSPGLEPAIPALLEVIQKDTNVSLRLRCVGPLLTVKTLEPRAIESLTKVLEDTTKDTIYLRYDVARVLARTLNDKTPDRAVELLLQMIADKNVTVFAGSAARVGGGGSEVKQNPTRTDGRYMAAQDLGKLGSKATGRKDVMDALEAATKDEDKRLREEAAKALERLKK